MSDTVVDKVKGSPPLIERWVERQSDRRPRGTHTLAEVEAHGLVNVPVFVTDRIYVDGRKVAVAGDVLAWDDAVRFGLVSPVQPVDRESLRDKLETRSR